MSFDLLFACGWLAVLAFGLGLAALLRKRGVATTYVRDLIHVGASVWIFGWPWWRAITLPAAIVGFALLLVVAVPFFAARIGPLRRLKASLAGGDETWSGIVLYVVAFAVLTIVGLSSAHHPGGSAFPSAAALCVLAWGDGLGGLVGRKFGRTHFRVPWAKTKSLEGCMTVALVSGIAISVVASWLGAAPMVSTTIVVAIAAAAVEAVAPRSSDNVLVPAVVWILLEYWA